MKHHDIVEKNLGLMTVLIVIAISFGGLVQIVPQFFLKETTGCAPFSPLPAFFHSQPEKEGVIHFPFHRQPVT